ncbi:MAG: HD domain-containing protein [Actinomycetia bacterium]|nr:HD domain-containing protein [Actinomycetes bacterium]
MIKIYTNSEELVNFIEKQYALLVDKALFIVLDLHKGQLDKSGYPYILHPLAVANAANVGYHPVRYIAGLLHDIVEDNPYVTVDYIQETFGEEIAYIVSLLTRSSGLMYFDYIEMIAESGNLDAIRVKLADLSHNLSRPGKSPVSLKKRYMKAKKILKAAI